MKQSCHFKFPLGSGDGASVVGGVCRRGEGGLPGRVVKVIWARRCFEKTMGLPEKGRFTGSWFFS